MHRLSGAEPVLQTKDLGKRYGNRWAVRGLNLQVHRGDVFGFLGPNGAGKSTTIRMVLSLIAPTSGEVELFGRSLNLHRTESLRSVGGIVEKPDFYLYLSAVRNLEIVGSLIGGVARQRILEVLDLVGLGDRGRDLVKTYSHGMKQRLGIAQALLGDPELVILDEPTNGLDPQGMKEIRELIVHLARDRRKTVFLSSHLLNEVEMVANRMAILAKGELVAQGEVEELLKSGGQYVFVTGEPGTRIRSVLRGRPLSVTKFEEKEGGFEIWMDQGDIPSLNAQLVRRGVRVGSIVPRRSLEEYFLSITEPQER